MNKNIISEKSAVNAIDKCKKALFRSITVDASFALFRLVIGIFYHSVWFTSLAFYYAILCFIRVFLLICYQKSVKITKDCVFAFENKSYLACALMLLILNIPLALIDAMVIVKNYAFHFPGYIIYLSATYTFYMATICIIDMIKIKKTENLLIHSIKTVNLVSTLVSILGLQTALIDSFSSDSEMSFRYTMNLITGAAVFFGVFAISVYMICKAVRTAKSFKGNYE